MRILYHHRTQADDGQAVHIRSLVRAFEAEGHTVEEVGLVRQVGRPAAASGSPEASGGDGARGWGLVTRVPRFARELAEYAYTPFARGRILRAAAGFEPDLLYERYAFGNAGGIQAARRLRRPLVLEVNSPMVLELSRTRGLSFPRTARRLEEHVFRSADRVCAVTAVLARMLEEMGVERERLLVTPNGVHLEAYADRDDPATRAAARADLGLPPEGLVLGFVGYQRPWHRLDLAVAALRTPGLEEVRLCLVGEGPADAEIRRAAEEHGVTERVVLAGRRPHEAIPRLLPAFDVALVPAINPYASPLKLHEYMAAGLAVVAPDQENLREVVEPGVNGFLVPAGDGAALAHACSRLAGEPELRARLGAAARRTIEERDLTWRGNARRVVAAVEAVEARP